ncbi:hypothetical protein K439DRAFT_1629692 [Ramaria rubella]|nr:hypothetical protein K439DRAFT_1629692 [Ramaria rubella]
MSSSKVATTTAKAWDYSQNDAAKNVKPQPREHALSASRRSQSRFISSTRALLDIVKMFAHLSSPAVCPPSSTEVWERAKPMPLWRA